MIQLYPNEMTWAFSKLGRVRPGYMPTEEQSFLRSFCDACMRADSVNYELLQPIVWKFMDKYPLEGKIEP